MGQALSARRLGTLGRKDETQSPWHTSGSFTAQERRRKKKTEMLVKPQPKYSHKKKRKNRDGTAECRSLF